jgi:outer membrane protein assembly factor BamB
MHAIHLRFPAIVLAFTFGLTVVWAGNWPQFRGPTGQGTSTESALPAQWTRTENVAWTAEIPGEGWSSPIVWGDRVFVTAALDQGVSCHLICLDRRDGRVLWDKEVLRQDTAGRKESRNTYATPTPATDGKRVYTVFFDGSFVAVDFEGREVWANREFKFYGQHGLGSSPILWEDLLIMARDGSSDGENKLLGWQQPWDKSHILALDKGTGQKRWQTGRGLSRISHSVPVIWREDGGRTWLLSAAGDVVQGFDPRTGERIWTSSTKGEGVVPSVAVGEGLVFSASGFAGPEGIRAFRIAGQGDLRTANQVWEQRKGMPHVPSLLYVKPHVYSVSDAGLAMCLKGGTGEIVWQQRLGGNFSASPVYGDGKVYFLSDTGETSVIEAGPEFKLLARNPLNEKCQASMAVSEGRLFIRSEKRLFCIGKKE